ncbi:hypothetical protein [Ruegeria lacuscaerulensis]|uniref:hypothetical protein n=1 Tax=Ruegeria lacuscaerulensis TaxID=55218 RepID=UPI0014814D74|nr:hypothetical protein [Ruegeria lacuscaerulensis]
MIWNIREKEPRPDGVFITALEVALKVHEIQMSGAGEHRVPARRGLDQVEGGELAARPISFLRRCWFLF